MARGAEKELFVNIKPLEQIIEISFVDEERSGESIKIGRIFIPNEEDLARVKKCLQLEGTEINKGVEISNAEEIRDLIYCILQLKSIPKTAKDFIRINLELLLKNKTPVDIDVWDILESKGKRHVALNYLEKGEYILFKLLSEAMSPIKIQQKCPCDEWIPSEASAIQLINYYFGTTTASLIAENFEKKDILEFYAKLVNIDKSDRKPIYFSPLCILLFTNKKSKEYYKLGLHLEHLIIKAGGRRRNSYEIVEELAYLLDRAKDRKRFFNIGTNLFAKLVDTVESKELREIQSIAELSDFLVYLA